MTKKLSIVRFKPKPEHFDEFVKNIQDWHNQVFANGDHRLMLTDDEVVAIVIRDSEMLQENVKRGVAWLDSQRPLLQEYNEVDRHTIPMTGDLVEQDLNYGNTKMIKAEVVLTALHKTLAMRDLSHLTCNKFAS